MATSPVMSDLIKWMDARIKMDMANDTIFNINAPKMVMYSGHDMTLVPTEQLLFKAFGICQSFLNNICIYIMDNLILSIYYILFLEL